MGDITLMEEGSFKNTALNTASPHRSRSNNAESVDIHIAEKLKRFEHKNRQNPCIFRVPEVLRVSDKDNDNFRPRFVSVGPYHYGDPRLEEMQCHKYRILDCILKRTGKDIKEFFDAVRTIEDDARACYQDCAIITSLSGDKFVEIMVLDACFVLDFLIVVLKPEELTTLGYNKEDPLFSKSYIWYSFSLDTLLLENQIPLFVLNQVLKVQFSGRHNDEDLESMLSRFHCAAVRGKLYQPEKIPSLENVVPTTCLELFWLNLTRGWSNTTKKVKEHADLLVDAQSFELPSVTRMQEAGVRIVCKKKAPFCDVKFKAGVLEIPQFWLVDTSEALALNLMAFELRCIDVNNLKIIPHLSFMDTLINTASDVKELRNHEIILSPGLSDEQILDFYNRIARRPIHIPVASPEISWAIYKYCKQRRHRWRANLIRNYFNTPWAIISVIAAAILVVVTIVQTVYTVAQFYQN